MKKILVLGGTGMAGHMITMYLEGLKKYDIYNTVNKLILNDKSILCNVFDKSRLDKIITKIAPNIIINCIGILNDKSDIDLQATAYINSFLPHYIEGVGKLNNIRIIHLSTDCVFTGKKGSYKEDDIKDEINMYGVSKNIGEIINKKDLTFRMSIIGPELKENGKGLFHWFMNQGQDISGYTRVYWSGITTLELSKAIDKAIDEELCGLYQLVPDINISKYNLLNLIKDEFNRTDINIIPYDNKIVDKSMVNTRTDFNFKVSSYKDMIKELRLWMIEHKNIYKQYFK